MHTTEVFHLHHNEIRDSLFLALGFVRSETFTALGKKNNKIYKALTVTWKLKKVLVVITGH